MTIALQLNHTYRTRDGNAEHTITKHDGILAGTDEHPEKWYALGGRASSFNEQPDDLVEDVTTQPAGPVRTETITRTTITPASSAESALTSAISQPKS